MYNEYGTAIIALLCLGFIGAIVFLAVKLHTMMMHMQAEWAYRHKLVSEDNTALTSLRETSKQARANVTEINRMVECIKIKGNILGEVDMVQLMEKKCE